MAIGDEEITIDAERIGYDKAADVVSAAGQVVIGRGDTVLCADAVELNRRTGEAEAVGNASLTSPDALIYAREMRLNLEEETGAMIGAEIHSRRLGYSLWGERVEKGGGQTYRIENGRFTTCKCGAGAPSWSIAGKALDVALDGYGRLYGGTFNVLDVPVLYLPRAAFPVNQDRQSGLLFPRVGLSNRRGFQVLQPFYWAIDKSQDATLSVDMESAARFGLVGEYRYALSRHFGGNLQGGYFNEAIRGRAREVSAPAGADSDVPENRWGVMGDHTQRLGPVEAYADLLVVGDDLFLREMNTFAIDNEVEVAQRTRPFTTSRAGLVQRWSRAVLQGQGVFYQNLAGRQDTVLHQAPQLRMLAQKQLGFDLLGEMSAGVTNFQRDRGIAGVRADIMPGVKLRLPLGRSVSGSVSVAVRETAYQLSEKEMCYGGFSGTDPDAPPIDLPSRSNRETVELRADLGTGLRRVFDFPHLGVNKLKHTIEPRLEYLYIPAVNQDDMPIFDGVDRIGRRGLLTYGLASRLLVRAADTGEDTPGEVYELTRLSVAQSFDAEGTIPRGDGSESTDKFSDIDLALRVNPSPAASVRLRSTYDTDSTALTSATVGVRLREPAALLDREMQPRLLTRMSLGCEYRFVADNGFGPDEERLPEIQQLDSSLVLRLSDRLGFRYATRYNIVENSFQESFFGLRILSACDCWSLDIGVTDKSNPNEVELRVQLALIGLG